MERDQNTTAVIELGTASTVTLGQPILAQAEPSGYRFVGFLED